MSTTRVRRLPVLDEYVEDGVSAVMVDDQVLALSELATLVLALLGDGELTRGELEAQLVAEVGEPAEGTVAAALDPILTVLADRSLIALEA